MARKSSTGNVTIRDIADKLGITHATVSRALNDHPQTNEKTKSRVRRVAASLGYIPNAPARSMRQQTSSLFGLVVPDIENPFYGSIAKAMAKALSEAGMQLMLAISEDDVGIEHREVLDLRSARVAGIAITPTAHPLRETLTLLKGVPSVQLIRHCTGGPTSHILLNDREGVEEAVLHLLDLGHRRIAYIGAPFDLSTGSARFQGFKDAHKRRGIAVKSNLVKAGAPRPAFGRSAFHDVFSNSGRPTAALIASPQLALGALEASHEMGLEIPREFSIISYGDADWFRATQPAITAMQLPIEETARSAVEVLLVKQRDGVQTRLTAAALVFRPILVLRGTTALCHDRR
jgi:LacI family transcriptional regulator